MCCVLFALHFFSLHAYNDWLNTSITAPDGSVTAVRHFVSRQVQYVQGPTGIRSSFTYQGRRLLSALQPSGELITMAYAELAIGAMGLASTRIPPRRSATKWI